MTSKQLNVYRCVCLRDFAINISVSRIHMCLRTTGARRKLMSVCEDGSFSGRSTLVPSSLRLLLRLLGEQQFQQVHIGPWRGASTSVREGSGPSGG